MPLSILPALIGGGASIISGLLKGGTSATTPTLSPEMQALQNQVGSYASGLMRNPTQGLAPMKLAATDQINRNYASMPKTVANSLSGMGFGASGKLGTAMYNTAAARSGDLTNLEGQYGLMAVNQANEGASLSEQLLNSSRGSSTSGYGSPGIALQSAGNGLSNLSTLLMLKKVLGQNGGSSGPNSNISWPGNSTSYDTSTGQYTYPSSPAASGAPADPSSGYGGDSGGSSGFNSDSGGGYDFGGD